MERNWSCIYIRWKGIGVVYKVNRNWNCIYISGKELELCIYKVERNWRCGYYAVSGETEGT